MTAHYWRSHVPDYSAADGTPHSKMYYARFYTLCNSCFLPQSWHVGTQYRCLTGPHRYVGLTKARAKACDPADV